MDFARKQLEKYGWTEGKGLGKHEDGMSEALKPKLKRSMTGIGHDAAADFTEHWWRALYDKAAGNIEVKEKNGRIKKIKAKDNTGFEITNSTWKLKKKRKTIDDRQEQYQDFFVKTAVLGSGGSRVDRVRESEEESEGEDERNYVLQMTDEELFAACGGRTAHKGARHGLKALGKLARIEQQEQLLLQHSKFNGYSHAQKLKKSEKTDEKIVEDTSLNSDEEQTQRKKKKSKKKHCMRLEIGTEELNTVECEDISTRKKKKSNESAICEKVENNIGIEEKNTKPSSKKLKKKKSDSVTIVENKNVIGRNITTNEEESNLANEVLCTNLEKSKKKRNDVDFDSNKCEMDVDSTINEGPEIKKKKKKRKVL